ncbi:hypothetical protein G6011_08315 [Alternaria panax]|uniref:Uncharacterized protein n=1 Tax=Alternaria panax TaxID=48097 RepID=A0AAD4I8J3_9PLEO|nr:hypothetical protein G6011_08315 [Alternaria panax]
MAPTFWGCCNEDPCMNNSTCPEGKLEPSFWDRPDQYYYFHDLNVALSSTVPAPTAFSTASSISTTASETSTTTAAASPSRVSGAVIGGAVGGSLAFLIIIAAVVFSLCRRQRYQKKTSTETKAANTLAIPKAELESLTTSTGLSPPPTYSWDTSGQHPQQKWAHYHTGRQELLGDTRRSKLYSPCGKEPAELHGGSEAGELESPQTTPKVAQEKFAHDTSKQQPSGLGVDVDKTVRLNAQA